MEKSIETLQYAEFVNDIKQRILMAQYAALRAVNKELIQLYWEIGKQIVEKQTLLGWGKSVVENLANDLQKEFPKTRGFSAPNLWFMRQFYAEYQNNEFLQSMIREIGWTHNLIILNKCKDNLERQFYILHTQKFGWTVRVLSHQIDNKTYEKYLLNRTNFDSVLPQAYAHQAKLAVKDHYTFDFLELADQHSERELQTALVSNIQQFLTEMGYWYTFVGSQFKINVGGKDYYIDLLLFHRKLRCLIAIELKIGDFQPEYKGKMEFYLTALNRQIKEESENNAIGIIVCRNKNETVVEYALSTAVHPIGIATYDTTTVLPENYRNYLPTHQQIAEKLNFQM
jgi:predicted nuclease of restriction endonuclease-like (RecB) superfamily